MLITNVALIQIRKIANTNPKRIFNKICENLSDLNITIIVPKKDAMAIGWINANNLSM